jgi:hypothetical protein
MPVAKTPAVKKPGKKRPFEQLSERDQLWQLFKCAYLITTGDGKIRKNIKNPYTLAAQYGATWKIKPSDFERIKGMTVNELVEKLTHRG